MDTGANNLGIYTFALSSFLLFLIIIPSASALDRTDPDPSIPPPPPLPDYSEIINNGCTDRDDHLPGSPLGAEGDGLCDSWERSSGIRIRHEGITYKYLCGAYGPDEFCPSHNKLDIYVEYDWLEGHAPTESAMQAVVDAFGPDIQLHLQKDEDTGTHWNQIIGDMSSPGTPGANPALTYDNLKKNYFGTPSDRSDGTLTHKRQLFHYALFIHSTQDTGLSGTGEILGNDFAISMGNFPTDPPTNDQQAGTFMHELGHNLGLHHGGPVALPDFDINCKPNQISVMSASRMTPDLLESIGFGNDWVLDYSRTDNILNEENINDDENLGLVGNVIIFMDDAGALKAVPVTSTGIDWNNNGNIDMSQTMDANGINAVECEIGMNVSPYEAHNEWANLDFKMREHANWSEDAVRIGNFAKMQDPSQKASMVDPPVISDKDKYFRDKIFVGTGSFTHSPRAQERAGIAEDDVICSQKQEFLYLNGLSKDMPTPYCIFTKHFKKFVENHSNLLKQAASEYLCDIQFTIAEEYRAPPEILDELIDFKTGKKLDCTMKEQSRNS